MLLMPLYSLACKIFLQILHKIALFTKNNLTFFGNLLPPVVPSLLRNSFPGRHDGRMGRQLSYIPELHWLILWIGQQVSRITLQTVEEIPQILINVRGSSLRLCLKLKVVFFKTTCLWLMCNILVYEDMNCTQHQLTLSLLLFFFFFLFGYLAAI